MKIDFEKIGIISSYFAENTKDLYVTKLLKLFYYFDFISYKIRGAPITNDIYLKLPYGPVPIAIKNEIDLLTAKGLMGPKCRSQLRAYIKLQPDVDENGKRVTSTNKNYNLRKLSNFELELMKNLAKTFENTRAKTLSRKTHKEKPWRLTSRNTVISYELADELDIKEILPSFNY